MVTLTSREKRTITQVVERGESALVGPRFWIPFSVLVSLAAGSVAVWFAVWREFGEKAAQSGLTRAAVYRLAGGTGRALTAAEADLVQTAWILEVTSIAGVLIVAGPCILLLSRRDSLRRLRVYSFVVDVLKSRGEL